ncbi:membrane bound O-acyl transferase family-domain-containing protein [Apiospora aurea]|uniref:Membrane bound O-acyl transferase family-domain-containing protein n=1 Tax=Apiospora aurea TaxID=335848 RepID=A0ABR1QIZ2_9PEZI
MGIQDTANTIALMQAVVSAFLFVAVFTMVVLVSPRNSVAERYSGAFVLAGLVCVFQSSLHFWCRKKGWVMLLVTTAWTTYWHALEMLLVSKVCLADIQELAAKKTKRHNEPPAAASKSEGGSEPSKDTRSGPGSAWQLAIITSALLCKWRRIGTKWQIPRLPRFSPDGSVPSKGAFLFRSLMKITGSYLMLSMFTVAPPPDPNLIAIERQPVFSRLDDISAADVVFRVMSTAVFFINVALMVTMWYYLVCVVSVVLGLAGPENCPPFYGSLSNAYTLRGLWRNIHQGLRKCVSGPADAFADSALRLPRGTYASRCIRLVLAFGVSAVIHAPADLAIGLSFAGGGQFYFFSMQAIGIIMESGVQDLWSRTGLHFPRVLQKAFGYLWVISWFCWITPKWSYTTMRHMDPGKDGIVVPAHVLAWFQ